MIRGVSAWTSLPTSEATASAWGRLRLANRSDEAEFLRLFALMAAEQGIEGHNEHKVLMQFDRAVRRDRAALVVTDKLGQLVGMVMCGYVLSLVRKRCAHSGVVCVH
jgi:hypothetical protein